MDGKKAQAKNATLNILLARSYEILDENYKCEHGEVVVAKQDETYVFVEIIYDMGKFPDEETVSRNKMENIAAAYCLENKIKSAHICFDIVSVNIISKDQAVVRHHLNAFSTIEKAGEPKLEKLLNEMVDDGSISTEAMKRILNAVHE